MSPDDCLLDYWAIGALDRTVPVVAPVKCSSRSISMFSLLMISAGVLLGAPMPPTPLTS